ncbi:hypothetical protein D3C78_993910 [compost metagenome]
MQLPRPPVGVVEHDGRRRVVDPDVASEVATSQRHVGAGIEIAGRPHGLAVDG